MRVISRKKLREAWTLLPEIEKPLDAWSKVTEKATWRRFSDVRATFKTVDQIASTLCSIFSEIDTA